MVVGVTSTHIIRKDIAKKKTEKINWMSAIPTDVRRMKFSICMLEFLINNIFFAISFLIICVDVNPTTMRS
jgi:hypothetical protein